MSHVVPLALLALLLGMLSPASGWADETPSREAVLQGFSARSFGVRRDAVWAARDHPDPTYLERLLVLARTDPHPNIRAWALQALVGYDDERVLPTLRAALAEDPNPFPQDVALESLGKLRAPGAFDTLTAHLAPGSRGTAVMRGLAALQDPRGFDVVLEFWDAQREDPYVAPAAPGVLVAMDRERGRVACLERFTSAPEAHRHWLETTLAALDDAAVRKAMAGHLGSSNAHVRRSAARVLGATGDPATDQLLLARFQELPEDRVVLARAIGRRGVPDAAPVLAKALAGEGTSPALRAALAEALGALGDARGVETLTQALPREADPLAAVQIAVALGRIADARARDALRALVDDDRVSRQPRTISSVWGFPWNCRVGDAAAWGWASITDGAPPFGYEDLSGFPEPPAESARDDLAGLRARLR